MEWGKLAVVASLTIVSCGRENDPTNLAAPSGAVATIDGAVPAPDAPDATPTDAPVADASLPIVCSTPAKHVRTMDMPGQDPWNVPVLVPAEKGPAEKGRWWVAHEVLEPAASDPTVQVDLIDEATGSVLQTTSLGAAGSTQITAQPFAEGRWLVVTFDLPVSDHGQSATFVVSRDRVSPPDKTDQPQDVVRSWDDGRVAVANTLGGTASVDLWSPTDGWSTIDVAPPNLPGKDYSAFTQEQLAILDDGRIVQILGNTSSSDIRGWVRIRGNDGTWSAPAQNDATWSCNVFSDATVLCPSFGDEVTSGSRHARAQGWTPTTGWGPVESVTTGPDGSDWWTPPEPWMTSAERWTRVDDGTLDYVAWASACKADDATTCTYTPIRRRWSHGAWGATKVIAGDVAEAGTGVWMAGTAPVFVRRTSTPTLRLAFVDDGVMELLVPDAGPMALEELVAGHFGLFVVQQDVTSIQGVLTYLDGLDIGSPPLTVSMPPGLPFPHGMHESFAASIAEDALGGLTVTWQRGPSATAPFLARWGKPTETLELVPLGDLDRVDVQPEATDARSVLATTTASPVGHVSIVDPGLVAHFWNRAGESAIDVAPAIRNPIVLAAYASTCGGLILYTVDDGDRRTERVTRLAFFD